MPNKSNTLRVITAYDANVADLADISLPLMRRYATIHEYAASLHNISVPGGELEDYFKRSEKRMGWIKIPAILEALKGDEEWILWLDVDVLVAKSEISVLNNICHKKDIYLVWHDLEEYAHPSHYNTGVMLIRNCNWSRDFFESIWLSHVGVDHKWWDQAAFLHLIGRDDIIGHGDKTQKKDNRNLSHIGTLDLEWNSIVGYKYAADPVMNHYAGVPALVRKDLMILDASMIAMRGMNRKEFDQARTKFLCLQRSVVESHFFNAVKFNHKMLELAGAIEADLSGKLRSLEGMLNAASAPPGFNNLHELRQSKLALERQLAQLINFVRD